MESPSAPIKEGDVLGQLVYKYCVSVTDEFKLKVGDVEYTYDELLKLLEKQYKEFNAEEIKFETAKNKLNQIIESRQAIISKHSDIMTKLCNDCKPIFANHYMLDKYQDEIIDANEKIEKIKSKMPSITLTTDIIVGFPGETTEEFEDTLDVLKKVRYDTIFSFIYSKRPGTPAAEMEDVISAEEKKKKEAK